jgi:hypothetical protein
MQRDVKQSNAFPTEYIMCYKLACYACQLGNLKEALQCIRLGGHV